MRFANWLKSLFRKERKETLPEDTDFFRAWMAAEIGDELPENVIDRRVL